MGKSAAKVRQKFVFVARNLLHSPAIIVQYIIYRYFATKSQNTDTNVTVLAGCYSLCVSMYSEGDMPKCVLKAVEKWA